MLRRKAGRRLSNALETRPGVAGSSWNRLYMTQYRETLQHVVRAVPQPLSSTHLRAARPDFIETQSPVTVKS